MCVCVCVWARVRTCYLLSFDSNKFQWLLFLNYATHFRIEERIQKQNGKFKINKYKLILKPCSYIN